MVAIILFSVHLSQGMIINCTHTIHVHYANFAVRILMNLINFNNILTSRPESRSVLSRQCVTSQRPYGAFECTRIYELFDLMNSYVYEFQLGLLF